MLSGLRKRLSHLEDAILPDPREQQAKNRILKAREIAYATSPKAVAERFVHMDRINNARLQILGDNSMQLTQEEIFEKKHEIAGHLIELLSKQAAGPGTDWPRHLQRLTNEHPNESMFASEMTDHIFAWVFLELVKYGTSNLDAATVATFITAETRTLAAGREDLDSYPLHPLPNAVIRIWSSV